MNIVCDDVVVVVKLFSAGLMTTSMPENTATAEPTLPSLMGLLARQVGQDAVTGRVNFTIKFRSVVLVRIALAVLLKVTTVVFAVSALVTSSTKRWCGF